MKHLIALLLFTAPSAFASSPALCEKKSAGRGVSRFDCAVPTNNVEQVVQITSELTAIYANYQNSRTSGIRVRFYSLKALLRTVDLDYTASDSESDEKVTVGLSAKVPVGSPVVGLEFDGVAESQSLTMRVVYIDAHDKRAKVDVFSAE